MARFDEVVDQSGHVVLACLPGPFSEQLQESRAREDQGACADRRGPCARRVGRGQPLPERPARHVVDLPGASGNDDDVGPRDVAEASQRVKGGHLW